MSKLNETHAALYTADTSRMNDNKLSSHEMKLDLLSTSEQDSEKLKLEIMASICNNELIDRNDRKNGCEMLKSMSEKFFNTVYPVRNDIAYGDMKNCLATDRIDRQYNNYLTDRNVAVDFTIHYCDSESPLPQHMFYIGKYRGYIEAIKGSSEYVLQEDAKGKTVWKNNTAPRFCVSRMLNMPLPVVGEWGCLNKSSYNLIMSGISSYKYIEILYAAKKFKKCGNMLNSVHDEAQRILASNYKGDSMIAVDITMYYIKKGKNYYRNRDCLRPPERLFFVGRYRNFVEALKGNNKCALQMSEFSELNRDDELRHNILGIEIGYDTGARRLDRYGRAVHTDGLKGIRKFEHMTINELELLIDNGFVDLDAKHEGAPTTREFMEFAYKYWGKTIAFHGYIVTPDRADYGVVIEGFKAHLYGRPSDNKDIIVDFIDRFRAADVQRFRNYEMFCWYDKKGTWRSRRTR